ncbi:Rap1a/Tai family immunity protein [Methylocystis sp. IM3]|uniref:Rap1a/Tai family immunity protein n=1 Tax=unclassified Methylocystis TaxID=2625913 RepID=UPI0030FB076F
MKMRIFFAACLIPILITEKAVGGTTGNDLLQSCIDFVEQKNNSGFFNQGVCAGAVNTTLILSEIILQRRSCPPNGVTTAQAVRVVIAYMQRHPEGLHNDIAAIAIVALAEAWPCANRQQ